MQDKSIDGALIALRKQIIRGNLDGLEHVEALLRLRSVPMPRVMIPKRSDAAKKGLMRQGVTYAQLADMIGEKEINIRNKLSRGKFSAAFFLQCLVSIGVSQLHI